MQISILNFVSLQKKLHLYNLFAMLNPINLALDQKILQEKETFRKLNIYL